MNQETKELTFNQLKKFINNKEQGKEFNIEIDLSHYNAIENNLKGDTKVDEK